MMECRSLTRTTTYEVVSIIPTSRGKGKALPQAACGESLVAWLGWGRVERDTATFGVERWSTFCGIRACWGWEGSRDVSHSAHRQP